MKSVLLFPELRLKEGVKVTFIPLYLYLRLIKVCRTIVYVLHVCFVD